MHFRTFETFDICGLAEENEYHNIIYIIYNNYILIFISFYSINKKNNK